jgi:hypothetical protein
VIGRGTSPNGAGNARGAENPVQAAGDPSAVSPWSTTPAARHNAAGGFSGHEPDLVDRFRSTTPERRVLLARIAALYAAGQTMAEVGEVMGMTYKEMRNVQHHWGLTSTMEARARASREHSAKLEAEAKALAGRIASVVAEHQCSVAEAGRRLGLSRDKAKEVAKRFSVRGVRIAAPMPQPKAQAPRATFPPDFIPVRNPNLSPAQQALVDASKAAMWRSSAVARKHVPPPANADALIAEAIAAGRVTKCPPMCAAPINNNRGF